MVCPWMPYGNILLYLEKHPNCSRLKLVSAGCLLLVLLVMESVKMHEAASGVEYLHLLQSPLLHGDIKAVCVFNSLSCLDANTEWL
jgi:hypothetical protein